MSIGVKKFKTNRGTSHVSLISPWIFNLYLGPLLIWLEGKLGTENVAAYADDITFLAPASLLDRTLTEMVQMANDIVMTINAKKTNTMQILHQRGKPLRNKTSFKLYEAVDEFKYLGTTINSRGVITSALQALKKRMNFCIHTIYKLPQNMIDMAI